MRRLRPVGDRIATVRAPAALDSVFPNMNAVAFYRSGTAALAAALRLAVERGPAQPEVILPAYGCPALVAAARFAGAEPILVDLEFERPWLSLDAVAEAVSAKTVAVVAVNLLGCGERVAELRDLIGDAMLVEDSAQHLSESGPRGDLVILSFGRGKPLSVLGGGAVLSPTSELSLVGPPVDRQGGWAHRLKLEAYNLLTHPLAYGMLERLPGLRIGETRYEALQAIAPIQESCLARLPPNLERYRRRERRVEEALATLVAQAPGISSLPALCGATGPFLRYPVLARDAEHAKTLMQRLDGLGVTRLYEVPLVGIDGVEALVSVRGDTPNARDFASRLLTLPTHEDVTNADLAAIEVGMAS